MKVDLKGFQLDKIDELNEAMEKRSRDIVLKSPTGSGKTIILTQFLHDYMRKNRKTVFVWLTPGKGNLEEQSQNTMVRYCHDAVTKNLDDVMTSGFAEGDAVFINWEKVVKKGNIALRDSERTNLLEWIQKAHDTGLKFKIIIDESHENFTERTETAVDYFRPDKIIRASATPNEDPNALWVEATDAEVIDAGLIKKLIMINPNFPLNRKFKSKDEVTFLLEQAYEKREELRQAFVKAGSRVNPLIVVQLPNNSDLQKREVEDWFAEKGVSRETGTLAVWLSDDKTDNEGISENDAKQQVIIIKQAIATGWDCPRAHILVKLRKNSDERFEIQTIGRIRRMPEATHYENDLLDSCYLYTLDEEFTSGARQHLGGGAQNVIKVFAKKEHHDFKLTKEQHTMVTDTRDPLMALEATYSHFVKAMSLKAGQDRKNVTTLETKGYTFSRDIVSKTKTGHAVVIDDLTEGSRLEDVRFSVVLDTHRHGVYFRHALGEIGVGGGLTYNEVRGIVSRLFGDRPDDARKFMALPPKELYAFVINNMRLLKDAFLEAMAAELKGEAKRNPIAEKEFHIPHEWMMGYDGSARAQKVCGKNVYTDYLSSAGPRSRGERKFEKWCETVNKVDWWYRNGDKGDEYFSIVYQNNAGKQRLFYPDYILSIGGETWIVEIKGGFNASGKSENIDRFAEKKSVALKAYCEKHGVHGGFVCYDDSEEILLLSQDGFDEDPKAACWHELDDVIDGN